VDLGFAVGTGIGSDAVADIRTTVMATVRFGKVQARAVGEEKPREITEEPPTPAEVKKEPEKVAPPPAKKPAVKPYTGIIVVMMAEGVADRDTERRITRALQQKGYATGMDPDPGVKIPKKNVLYYNPGMQEQAIAVSRLLVANKYLKDLEVLESPIRITRDWLLLIPGGVKKK
jgi:hypothetical protein